MYKKLILCVGLIAFCAYCALAQGAALFAGNTRFVAPTQKQEENLSARLQKIAEQQKTPSRGHLTADLIFDQLDDVGQINGCQFAAIVADTEYVKTLDIDTASELAYGGVYADFSGSGCQGILKREVLDRLAYAPYDEDSADFPIYSFYAMTAVGLGYNLQTHTMVQNWAFEQVSHAALRTSTGREGVWAAVVLSNIAMDLEGANPDEVYGMTRRERLDFEQKLENVIAAYDWLQAEKADYFSPHIKGNYKSNQSVLLSLFSQVNNWFSTKDDSSFLKSMITTGSLNAIGRGDEGQRFSDRAESFYLHHPTPGTDGRGHWANSDNGRKHQILALLVQAISMSYASREDLSEGARDMRQFVERKLATSPAGFKYYLFVPLHAMRNGKILFDGASLNGWEREETALQQDLYQKIKKHYSAYVVFTTIQGGTEVAAEWEIIGKILGVTIKGIGVVGKTATKVVVNHLSAEALMSLAAVQFSSRHVVQVSKAGIKSFMKKAGWKVVAAGGMAAAVTSDTSSTKRANQLAY